MEPRHDPAIVFFASAEWSRRPVGWRRRVAIARRFPRKTLYGLLSWLVRSITRSPLAHCAIAHGGAVLDPSLRGDRFWPLAAFVRVYPSLVVAVEISTPRPVNLDSYQPGGSKRVLPTVLRWWTRGRWPTRDCVCTVVNLLRAAGLDVPKRIYRPIDLFNWLERHGQRTVHFEDAAAGRGPARLHG